jgi:predicted phosphoribosyltransferase/nucleotide-binding universal stress UspA family protein
MAMSKGLQHIMVATDFGPASSRAVEAACEVAHRSGAALTALHVIESTGRGWATTMPPEVRRSAAFRLDELLKGVTRHVARVEGCLREGLAWQEITRAATEIGTDLIVIGSNGGAPDPHFRIGSVAERVVRSSPIPVLTVHAWRFDDRAQAGRELAEILLRTPEQSPSIIALSVAGAAVAAEIAEAFGTPLHLFHARPIVHEGRVLGAVCEDGTTYFTEGAPDLGDETERAAARRAHGELHEDARHLHTPSWRPPPRDDAVLIVSDAILHMAPMVAAARALRRLGARRIMAIAPVASRTALAGLAGSVDQTIVLQVVDDDAAIEHIYRHAAAPDHRTIGERAAATARWAETVELPAKRSR